VNINAHPTARIINDRGLRIVVLSPKYDFEVKLHIIIQDFERGALW